MGKRSSFKREERDYYKTPLLAVLPLIPHLPGRKATFIEPCAGDGRLINHITSLTEMECVVGSDIFPQRGDIIQMDALKLTGVDSDYIITNPPWDRKILHPMISHLRKMAPTWLLFDADWMHTKQSIDYMRYCSKIVSIGRVKWIEDSNGAGKDNCCWYLFENYEVPYTIFYGRKEFWTERKSIQYRLDDTERQLRI